RRRAARAARRPRRHAQRPAGGGALPRGVGRRAGMGPASGRRARRAARRRRVPAPRHRAERGCPGLGRRDLPVRPPRRRARPAAGPGGTGRVEPRRRRPRRGRPRRLHAAGPAL
ncbi:MAG: hypothetical protein AVDCRST_MAG32-266, partial [uncultured Nocardioides sp.]